jgi:hypothetical protein
VQLQKPPRPLPESSPGPTPTAPAPAAGPMRAAARSRARRGRRGRPSARPCGRGVLGVVVGQGVLGVEAAPAGEQQRQLQAITEDQARLRANLREVPQSSPLHRRYLDKLGQQEDEVEKYRADIKRLQGQGHARRKALDDFLAAFSAE